MTERRPTLTVFPDGTARMVGQNSVITDAVVMNMCPTCDLRLFVKGKPLCHRMQSTTGFTKVELESATPQEFAKNAACNPKVNDQRQAQTII